MKRKNNSLLNSVLELKKLEFQSDMMLAYEGLQKELGENFENQMEFISNEIIALQKEARRGTTYFIAGVLLTLPQDKDNEKMTEEDFTYYSQMVKAAIHWGRLKGYK